MKNVLIFATDEEKIGQKRRKKINHFNQFFDPSGGNPSSGGNSFFSSFGGDAGSSSWSFGMGGGGATGGGHGNVHSMGGNVNNYGNQQQQHYHSMMGPSRSFGDMHSHQLPPVSNMFGGPPQGGFMQPPHYPGSSSMNYGFRDRGGGSRPVKSEQHDSMGSQKCLLCIK